MQVGDDGGEGGLGGDGQVGVDVLLELHLVLISHDMYGKDKSEARGITRGHEKLSVTHHRCRAGIIPARPQDIHTLLDPCLRSA